MISAIILTLNEESTIVSCIQALQTWCKDIVVYDSFSTDRTVELARQAGVRVYQRKFDNYARQRNAALKEVSYENEWAVMVDADEIWDAELGHALEAAIAAPENQDVDIFHVRRRDMFLGRWLKHNIGAGTWSGRILRIRNVEIQRDINEEYHCRGRKAYLQGLRFIHHPFAKGVSWWLIKHNRYSDMEARRLLEERSLPVQISSLWGRDTVARRKTLKLLLYRIPFRPVWMFFMIYIGMGGFLDGMPGFHYSVLRSVYEYMIDVKMRESRYLKEKLQG